MFYNETINALNDLSTVNMEIINKPSPILQKDLTFYAQKKYIKSDNRIKKYYLETRTKCDHLFEAKCLD